MTAISVCQLGAVLFWSPLLCLYLVWYMRLPSRGPRDFGRLHTALTVVTVVSSLAMIEVPLDGVVGKYDVPDVNIKFLYGAS